MALPAVTVAASAVLVRPMLPQFTVTAAVELLFVVLASTAAETVAVLLMLGQSPATVVRLSLTVRMLPLVSVPKLQLRVPVVIEQEPASAPPRVQVPAVSVSLTVTLVEAPGPPALTRMVKVAVPPALTAALPVFWIETSGQFTVVLTVFDVSGPGVTVDEFVTVPQAAAVGVTLIVIVGDAPTAMEPSAQVTFWPEIEHVPWVGTALLIVRPAAIASVTETLADAALPVFVTVIVYEYGVPSVAVAGPLLLIASVANGSIAPGWMLRSWLPMLYSGQDVPVHSKPVTMPTWTGAPLTLLTPPYCPKGFASSPQKYSVAVVSAPFVNCTVTDWIAVVAVGSGTPVKVMLEVSIDPLDPRSTAKFSSSQ